MFCIICTNGIAFAGRGFYMLQMDFVWKMLQNCDMI